MVIPIIRDHQVNILTADARRQCVDKKFFLPPYACRVEALHEAWSRRKNFCVRLRLSSERSELKLRNALLARSI